MQRSGHRDPESEIILLAVMGMSPAVLTETVWALAHAHPPVIPHKVFVITTLPGADAVRQILFREGGWHRLLRTLAAEGKDLEGRLEFGPATSCILPIPRPGASGDLEDITTSEESAAAADLIMREVRKFTEDDSTTLIASVAGGRKTMGVLLAQCVSLLGRPRDRLCHVLVSRPFDSPEMQPLFLFPEPGLKHRFRGRLYRSESAAVELTEIPFVPFRALYEQTFRRAPISYMSLVRGLRQSAVPASVPAVTVDWKAGRVLVGDRVINLSLTEFAAWATVLHMIKSGETIDGWEQVLPRIEILKQMRNQAGRSCWLARFSGSYLEDADDVRKAIGRVREKLLKADIEPSVVYRLVPALRSGIPPLPAQKIHMIGTPPGDVT